MRGQWSDFFPHSSFITHTSKINQTAGNHFVCLTVFDSLSSAMGGAVCVTGDIDTKLLVEYAMFLSCFTTSGKGGGIFFGADGQFAMTKVCGVGCFTFTREGQLSYASTTKGSIKINYYLLSSCSECGLKTKEEAAQGDRRAPIFLYHGRQKISSVNISNNKCYYQSTLNQMGHESETEICETSFCTYCNNYASQFYCVLVQSGKIYYMSFTNIISNEQSEVSANGIVYLNGKLTLKHCSFIGNVNFGNVFSLNPSSASISDSFIDLLSGTNNAEFINNMTQTYYKN